MKKLITLIFTASVAFAGLYDYPYLENNNEELESPMDKHLMYGDFEQILRFDPLFFAPSTHAIKQESQDYIEEIVNTYDEHKDKNMTITIIGHTDYVETKTERVNKSWWSPKSANNLTQESSQEIALDYAKYAQKQLVDKGVPEDIIIIEQRAGFDNLYTRVTREGRELNYRAMVAMYIEKGPLADDDGDGVVNSKDKCQFTPIGHNVSEDGCSELLNLTIHYNHNSSVIRDVSFERLIEMIEFLKVYPDFKILLYGHTSSEGTVPNNQILSEKRALSIKNYMVDQGIDGSRITFYGKASVEPLLSNDTELGREENRRVEIRLY